MTKKVVNENDLLVKYRGFSLHAYREESMGGWEMLYYSIFRDRDGLEVSSGFYDGSESPKEYIEYLKKDVDSFIKNPSDYE